MRSVLAAVSLFVACAHSPSGPRVRKSDPAPPAVQAAAMQAVVVYVEADCKDLDRATARGGGFWVSPRIVVTAGHLMDAKTQMFPEFAIVGPDGCVDGQYGDWQEAVDVLFILARGRHEGHLELAKRLPDHGEAAYQVSFEARAGEETLFSRRRLKIEKFADSNVYFGARPIPQHGDSGSPVLAADGSVIGLAVAIGERKDLPDHPDVGVYLSSLVIDYFYRQCGPCEEE